MEKFDGLNKTEKTEEEKNTKDETDMGQDKGQFPAEPR